MAGIAEEPNDATNLAYHWCSYYPFRGSFFRSKDGVLRSASERLWSHGVSPSRPGTRLRSRSKDGVLRFASGRFWSHGIRPTGPGTRIHFFSQCSQRACKVSGSIGLVPFPIYAVDAQEHLVGTTSGFQEQSRGSQFPTGGSGVGPLSNLCRQNEQHLLRTSIAHVFRYLS